MSGTGESGGKVVGVGLALVDHLLLWEDASRPVAEGRVLDSRRQGGGMVGTALSAVTRLGGAAEFWGVVGRDRLGDEVVADLAAEGIDTSQVRREGAIRGPAVVVCVDGRTGERRFVHGTGVRDADGGRPVGDLARLGGAACLLIDATIPASQLPAAAEARRRGLPVVCDFSAVDDRTRPLLDHVDYALFPELCLGKGGLPADPLAACRRLLELGPRCAVVTLGAAGLAFAAAGGQAGTLGAFEVDVVDTTGAGDVFHGAFCHGLTRGLALAENLRLASAAAAIKCTRLGGRAGIPTCEQIERFLESGT